MKIATMKDPVGRSVAPCDVITQWYPAKHPTATSIMDTNSVWNSSLGSQRFTKPEKSEHMPTVRTNLNAGAFG